MRSRRVLLSVLLLCLIAAASAQVPCTPVATAGQEAAATIRTHYTKHGFPVPMLDGVRLFTSVYAPRDAGQQATQRVFRRAGAASSLTLQVVE